ncbi:hypothetical protein HBB16_16340 [Pseudonocardia sp. MCCB 268]|nr:hypothetical protein [Pseudonocardia cytotoxica]
MNVTAQILGAVWSSRNEFKRWTADLIRSASYLACCRAELAKIGRASPRCARTSAS